MKSIIFTKPRLLRTLCGLIFFSIAVAIILFLPIPG